MLHEGPFTVSGVASIQDYLETIGLTGKVTFNNIEPHTYANLALIPRKAEGLTLPTEQQVIDGVAALQAEWDAHEYHRTRATKYPQLAEQLDLLYHDITAGKLDETGEFYKAIKAIKDATPKP